MHVSSAEMNSLIDLGKYEMNCFQKSNKMLIKLT